MLTAHLPFVSVPLPVLLNLPFPLHRAILPRAGSSAVADPVSCVGPAQDEVFKGYTALQASQKRLALGVGGLLEDGPRRELDLTIDDRVRGNHRERLMLFCVYESTEIWSCDTVVVRQTVTEERQLAFAKQWRFTYTSVSPFLSSVPECMRGARDRRRDSYVSSTRGPTITHVTDSSLDHFLPCNIFSNG